MGQEALELMVVWFAMRGSGVVALALMTLAVALGVLSTVRADSVRWPRFATQTLHRNVSLLATALLAVHAVTAVIHTFVDIRWYDVFLPVGGEYVAAERPGMALASLATDLTIAVVVTSLVRERLSHRWWRVIHLFTYLAWVAGTLHAILVGTDAATWWALGVILVGGVIVVLAGMIRLWTARHEVHRDAVDAETW